MDALIGLLAILGGAMMVVSWIWVVIIAFRDDGFLWGIGSLLLGVVGVIYMFLNFDECRTPFWVGLAGLVLVVIVSVASGGLSEV